MKSRAALVEAQTLEGLSGSPVFTRKGEKWALFLLGIYQSAWDGRPGEVLEKDRNLSGKGFRVPVGMGTVVPAWKIIDILDYAELKEPRTKAWT
jgi:hypothetical protein